MEGKQLCGSSVHYHGLGTKTCSRPYEGVNECSYNDKNLIKQERIQEFRIRSNSSLRHRHQVSGSIVSSQQISTPYKSPANVEITCQRRQSETRLIEAIRNDQKTDLIQRRSHSMLPDLKCIIFH
jgi:hypothetical protein